MTKPLDLPAFFRAYLSHLLIQSSLLFFWNLTPFSLPAWLVSALDGLLLIKFCFCFSPFPMGLAYSSLALGQFLLRMPSQRLSTLSGIPFFSTNLFPLAFFHALLVGLHFSFLIGVLAWFFKIIEVIPFESIEVLPKNPFLVLYFSLFSSMIFLLLCFLPSAVLFVPTTWPFGPSFPRSLLR